MRRILMMAFCALTLGTLALDLWRGPGQGGVVAFSTISDLFSVFDPASAESFQAMLKADLPPAIYSAMAEPLLSAPLFIVSGLLTLILWIVRPRRSKAQRNMIFPRNRRR